MPREDGSSGAKAKGQSEVDKETGTGIDNATTTVTVHPESQTPVTSILTEVAAFATSEENEKKSRSDERKLEPVSFNKNSRMPTSHHSIDAAVGLSQQEGKILLNQGPKLKSVSMDAMTKKGVSKRSNGASLPNDNNNDTNPNTTDNGQPKRDSRTVIGRLFWSHKVSPALLQEVVTIQPLLCPTSDGNRCLSCCHSQQRVDIPHQHGQLPGITRSNDSMEKICRICHDSPSHEKLIAPCLCKGSMGKVHRTCLERWLGESGKSACEICGQEYNTVRIPKYTGFRSLIAWIRNPLSPTDSRNFFFDMACFFILTPLACLSAWLCALGAKHYSLEEHRLNRRYLNETMESRVNRDASNSTWTSVGLLSLTGTLVAAYCIWIFVAIRYHLQVWREWRQRNFVVTIVPLSNGDFSRSPPPPRVEESPEVNPGSAESSSSSVERRVREFEEADRNNNANADGRLPNPPRVPTGVGHTESGRDFENENLLQSPVPEYSETALFYQEAFGGDSNEALSEEKQIRIAVLRSQAEAFFKEGFPPQGPMNSSKVEVPIKSEQSAVQLSAFVTAATDEDAVAGSTMKMPPNSSSSTISSNKAADTVISILVTGSQDGPHVYEDESSTDESAQKKSLLDNQNLTKDTEVKPDVIMDTRKKDTDEPMVVVQGEIKKNNNNADEGQKNLKS